MERDHYDGFDIVSSLIGENQKKFSSNTIKFHVYSGDPGELPTADLLIAKDVLQHLSDAAVKAFLTEVKRYNYAIITNCVNPHGATVNADIEDGGFRYLDLRLPPFSIEAEELFSFTNQSADLHSFVFQTALGKKGAVSPKPNSEARFRGQCALSEASMMPLSQHPLRRFRNRWQRIRASLFEPSSSSSKMYNPLVLNFENPQSTHNAEIVALVPVSPTIGRGGHKLKHLSHSTICRAV